MSEFHITTVRLREVQKHPNAETLALVKVFGGYPVIFKHKDFGGNFQEGDLAVYVPVDSVVPATPDWAWLSPPLPNGSLPLVPREKDRRIKAKRLRGVFSMGCLALPPPSISDEGVDVAELMGIKKWEEPEEEEYRPASRTDGCQVPAPRLKTMPPIYGIEAFRRYPNLFEPGEEFVLTEKIHGQNARFVFDGEKLVVGSHKRWLNTEPRTTTWADVALKYNLLEKLKNYPGLVLFGETYGNNSDMPYGVIRKETGDAFLAFDVWDSQNGCFLDYDQFLNFCFELKIPTVPELWRGRWNYGMFEHLLSYAEGKTTLNAPHTREGFVIRSLKERKVEALGFKRLILKLHGEGYLTRK